MKLFRDLERRIDEQLRRIFQSGQPPAQRREMIEIQRSIIEDVLDRTQLLPRARRVFPFDDVTVRIPMPEPERRAAVQLVFIEGDALANEIKEHLRREEIEFPGDLRISVRLLEEPLPDLADREYHVVYANRAKAAPVGAPSALSSGAVRITVVEGSATQGTYEVSRERVNFGRMTEVLDDRRRPVRRNDVAFDEGPTAANATVSRAHAHIEWKPDTREFRLFDDGSAYGTSVLHEGKVVEVPQGGGRGVRLHSGDEIYLGHARLRFETLPDVL